MPEEVDQRLSEIEAALAAIDERPTRFDAEDMARAGAFVSIDGSGSLRVERGYARAETPRLSGVQIKAPMSLTEDGALVPAIDQPFTHILKPAGTAGFDMLPIVEWLCLEVGRAAGFETPDAALIAMPDGMPPALFVERFDIRRGPQDQRLLAMEDFYSLLDLPTSAKYDGTIERMARALRPLAATIGSSSHAAWPTQSHNVERSSSIPWRA